MNVKAAIDRLMDHYRMHKEIARLAGGGEHVEQLITEFETAIRHDERANLREATLQEIFTQDERRRP